MKVIVLGAGIVGTASAWFLNKSGHEVTVVERQPGASLETSFANGCQISVSHAEPWANPSAPLKVLKWLGKEDAPLLYRFRPEWLQWKWALRFLRECTPGRTAANIRQIVAIAEYSRQTLQAVRHTEATLREMVRVGREAIVSFPNFGHWNARLQLALPQEQAPALARPCPSPPVPRR